MRMRSVTGLCLLTMLSAVGAFASVAHAEQFEYGSCQKAAKNAEKEYTGEYGDKNCTKEVGKGGKYQFVAFVADEKTPVIHAGKGKAASLSSAFGTVTCKGSTGSVTLLDPKTSEGTVAFSGCASAGEVCTSEGQKGGGIQAKVIVKLDYRFPKEVSVEIIFGSKATELEYQCGGGPIVVVTGSTDGWQTGDVNLMSTKFLDTWGGPEGTSRLVAEAEGVTAPATVSVAINFKKYGKQEVKTTD